MKIIFLDIDGVLNHQLMWEETKQADRHKKLPSDVPNGVEDICEKSVKLLNILIERTSAKVVISSSWRLNRTVEELQKVLDYRGFEGKVIDKTIKLNFKTKEYNYSVPRGCEIKAWLEMNKGIIGDKISKVKYVILDDDSDMLYWQRNNYIQVDNYCGLTFNTIQSAIHILD